MISIMKMKIALRYLEYKSETNILKVQDEASNILKIKKETKWNHYQVFLSVIFALQVA